jgi:hypothetical protein
LYYNADMKATVQARLDADSRKTLNLLVSRLGWTPSRVVREGLRLLAATHPAGARPRIAGMGKFASEVRDLGSNPEHLKGFGR